MRSVQSSVPAELSTQARIRDAAVERFATDGLDAPLRTIAQDAGVSAALIVHHFGSAAGLRQACLDRVLEMIEHEKSRTVVNGDTATLFTQMAEIEGYAPVVGLAVRALQAGGQASQVFFEGMVASTLNYIEAGVQAGSIRPSRDPRGRARLLVSQSVGLMLINLPGPDGRLDMDTLPAQLRELTEITVLPALELYSEPLLTSNAFLDAYLAEHPETPGPAPLEETP